MTLTSPSKHDILLQNIKRELPKLEEVLNAISDHWVYEDYMYRFYHHSFKVFWIQGATNRIIEALKECSPHEDKNKLDPIFLQVLEGNLDKEFHIKMNKDWVNETKDLTLAFLHAKYFLEMAVKSGKELESAPQIMPSGWAAVTTLFCIRNEW